MENQGDFKNLPILTYRVISVKTANTCYQQVYGGHVTKRIPYGIRYWWRYGVILVHHCGDDMAHANFSPKKSVVPVWSLARKRLRQDLPFGKTIFCRPFLFQTWIKSGPATWDIRSSLSIPLHVLLYLAKKRKRFALRIYYRIVCLFCVFLIIFWHLFKLST